MTIKRRSHSLCNILLIVLLRTSMFYLLYFLIVLVFCLCFIRWANDVRNVHESDRVNSSTNWSNSDVNISCHEKYIIKTIIIIQKL